MFKKYKPKKDIRFGIAFFSCPLIIWIILLFQFQYYLFLLALIVTLLFLWMWFSTSYRISDELFQYQCGPFSKKIPINKIIRINRNVRSWVGMRPALTFEYLQIRYNKYDDVFIAPLDEEEFIEDITKINPNILMAN